MKVAKLSFLNEKSYNKTVIDFNFGRHKDLSTRKSDNSPRPLIVYYHMRAADARTVRLHEETLMADTCTCMSHGRVTLNSQ